MILELEVPTAELLTSNRRVHYRVRHAREQALQVLARERAALPVAVLASAAVVVRVWHPDARRRDVHNLMPSVKPMVDGLVQGGLLPDDNDEHLLGPFLVAERERSGTRGVTRFRIEVTPGTAGVLVGRVGPP